MTQFGLREVLIALHYLKDHNPLYTDIEINENWIQTWQEEDKQLSVRQNF